MKNLILIFALTLVIGCRQSSTSVEEHPSGYSIAPMGLLDLALQSIKLIDDFDFTAWGAMLADDAEYYFPDGDPRTRTKLIGRSAILDRMS